MRNRKIFMALFHDLLNLFFPRTCACCPDDLLQNEQVICTLCRQKLPFTNAHLQNENEIEKVFYGRVRIENAISLLIFEKKGITQRLMHDLKYRGNKAVGLELGNWMADNLQKTSWAAKIEVVVPVPLHKTRLRKRGYNQVEGFGKTIAYSLKIPYNDQCLVKTHGAKTQVFKNLSARFKNVAHNFEIAPAEANVLKGKHILLVDDIVTTGATLETCTEKLLKIPNTKVSIATMAETR